MPACRVCKQMRKWQESKYTAQQQNHKAGFANKTVAARLCAVADPRDFEVFKLLLVSVTFPLFVA